MTTMTTAQAPFDVSARKDWGAAFMALRRLLADAEDTAQVFRIMRALNAGSVKKGYLRLLATQAGGRLAFEHVELAQRLSDPAFLAGFAPGTLGAAYRDFLSQTGFTAQGLADVSRTDDNAREAPHPYAWFARRMRDSHDLWHILTGYRADDPLGEACLVAFSYAQTGGPGWGFIALGTMLRSLRLPRGLLGVRAIWEGYRLGRRALWLPGEDYVALLGEPLAQARVRLRIGTPHAYERVCALGLVMR
jgi:ubiquinone biosynthesis protein COQ4